jgi:nicotinate-nucleotide--dimethylbenzimidazole phosphoribosyltransferase
LSDPLLTAAEAITDPDAAAGEAARAGLGPGTVYGRLADLLGWWASARGQERPVPPRRVLLAGGGRDVAARRRGARALAPPRAGTVEDAISRGISTADEAADDGTDLIVLCLDEPSTWRVMSARLMTMEPVEALGWPRERGMDDMRWMDEVSAIRDRLTTLRAWGTEPCRFLHALGDTAAACAVALLVQATARRTPVLLDGPGATAAGLLAIRAHYGAPRWWRVAHEHEDPLHERMLGSLGMEAVTRLEIAVEDGTASLAALALLDTAVALLAPPGGDGGSSPLDLDPDA